jgi:hypothetical protein
MSKATGTRTASRFNGQAAVFPSGRLSRAAALYEPAAFLRVRAAREADHATPMQEHGACICELAAQGESAMPIPWHVDTSFWNNRGRAEHAFVDQVELIALVIAADRFGPPTIGWEIFGGREYLTLLAIGNAPTFEAAKAACERAWREMESRR